MKLAFGLSLTLVFLLMVVATKGHTVIQCYVCDDCEKVDKNTPVKQCGGENFTMTTTTTTMSPSSESKTSSSTTETQSSSSTSSTTTTTTTTELPTAPTVGPISSTSGVPTPPSLEGSAGVLLDRLNQSLSAANSTLTTTTPSIFVTPTGEVVSSTTPDITELFPLGNSTLNETIPSALLVRQRRHTEFNGITYYCYKVQKKYGSVFGTKRGCIGIKAEESVCDNLNMENGNQTKKCMQCTTTKCNGSSAMSVSIATLLIGLLALIYKN